MTEVLHAWQYLPTRLDPVAFSFGSVTIYWYALFFLFGSGLVYSQAKKEYLRTSVLGSKEFPDFAFGVFVSALLGGKLGFLLIYWWPFIEKEQSFVPTVTSGVGLPGMSFVGGMIAVGLYLHWYAARKQKNFFALTDVLALFIPLAILLGRLGSFVHGELVGRVTQVPWGMYFYNQTFLRHPSTLYAAFLEGFLLFTGLFFLRKQNVHKEFGSGFITACFCIGYGALRFFAEFFREPDSQIGYIGLLTLNQIFSVGMVIVGIVLLTTRKPKNKVY